MMTFKDFPGFRMPIYFVKPILIHLKNEIYGQKNLNQAYISAKTQFDNCLDKEIMKIHADD